MFIDAGAIRLDELSGVILYRPRLVRHSDEYLSTAQEELLGPTIWALTGGVISLEEPDFIEEGLYLAGDDPDELLAIIQPYLENSSRLYLNSLKLT